MSDCLRRKTCQAPTMKTLAGRLWNPRFPGPRNCAQTFKARGFASELEDWNFYLDMGHTSYGEEVDEDVASCAASCLKRTSRAKLSWRKTNTGRRHARRVGSGVTQSSLPTIQEEKACNAFFDRIHVAEPDDFERRGLDGRTIFTLTLRSLS
eukprot:337521-Amphidinium_carterae.1